jgi:hypothetical protein
MFVIGLVEKHILAIASLGRPFFKYALVADTVLSAQTLPEDRTNFEAPLIRLQCQVGKKTFNLDFRIALAER